MWIFEPRILPSRRAAASSSGIRAARMNGRAPSAGGRQALRRASRRHGTGRSAAGTAFAGGEHIGRGLVDEQQHRRDEGRQPARPVRRRAAGVTQRGLLPYRTKPTASAPAATAASTSCSRVRPQILMRVRWAERLSRRSWQPIIRSRAAGQVPLRRRRPAPGSTGRRAKRWAPPRRGRGRPAPGSSIAGGCWPWPIASRQPMMLRIMWCRKASASKSKRQ